MPVSPDAQAIIAKVESLPYQGDDIKEILAELKSSFPELPKKLSEILYYNKISPQDANALLDNKKIRKLYHTSIIQGIINLI